MKYLPVIDVWNNAINAALRSGQLKLQRGQWISCGGKPYSRFVGINLKTGTIDACHGGNGKEVTRKFLMRVQVRKDTIKRFGTE